MYIKKKYSDIEILSMGMSNDYKLATKMVICIELEAIFLDLDKRNNIYAIVDIETTGGKYNEEGLL